MARHGVHRSLKCPTKEPTPVYATWYACKDVNFFGMFNLLVHTARHTCSVQNVFVIAVHILYFRVHLHVRKFGGDICIACSSRCMLHALSFSVDHGFCLEVLGFLQGLLRCVENAALGPHPGPKDGSSATQLITHPCPTHPNNKSIHTHTVHNNEGGPGFCW